MSVTAQPGNGVTIAAADGSVSMNIAGRVVARETLLGVNTPGPDEYTNELNIRAVRLGIAGNLFVPELRYHVLLGLGGSEFETSPKGLLSASPVLDAWVQYRASRDVWITAGQFFVPFDRAGTLREYGLQFVDRPLSVFELGLARDVGISISSPNLFGLNKISYALGVFGGDGRNRALPTRPGFLYVWRLAVLPFGPFDDDVEGDLTRIEEVRLAIGAGAAFNHRTDRPRSTSGPPLALGTFDYWHVAGDVVLKYAGLSFFAEILYRDTAKDQNDTEWSRKAYGYFLQSAYMITGMLEVAVRWSELRTFNATDPALVKLVDEQGRELGGGLNLYLSGHRFKIQLDYFHVFGASFTAGRDVTRLQLGVLL